MNTLSTVSLDSFQLIVAIYLFYVAAKGSGTLYRFGDLPEEEETRIRPKLRLIYFTGGLIALAETGVCMLQNSMFSIVRTETGGAERIQNFQLDTFPFLTFEMMSMISSLLSLAIILLLAGTFVWIRKKAVK